MVWKWSIWKQNARLLTKTNRLKPASYFCLKEGPCVLLCTQPRKEKKNPWTVFPCQMNACSPRVRSRTRVHTLRAWGWLQGQGLARSRPSELTKTLTTILRTHKGLQGYMHNFQHSRNVASESRGEQGAQCEHTSRTHWSGWVLLELFTVGTHWT